MILVELSWQHLMQVMQDLNIRLQPPNVWVPTRTNYKLVSSLVVPIGMKYANGGRRKGAVYLNPDKTETYIGTGMDRSYCIY
jgi:hypothetical protein